MLDLVLKIASMVVTLYSSTVKAIDLIYKFKHQKATAPTKVELLF